MEVVVVWPVDHLSPGFSAVVVWSLALLGPALLVGFALLTWRRNLADAARAAVAFDASAPLAEGPAIVGGRVEHAADRDTAVRTEITQHGSEKEHSGSWSHKWTEKERRIEVAPFYVRRPDGERIRVEPDRDVFLVDDLDGCILVNRDKRIRSAELVPDEKVIAKGVLHRDLDPESRGQAYRDSPTGWVLRPARRGAMYLSSEPLENRFLRKARFHRNAALSLLAPIVVLQLFLIDYYALRWTGSTAEARVIEKRTYTTENDDGVETLHYRITTAVVDTNREVASDVHRGAWRSLRKGDLVAVRIAARHEQLGHSATVHTGFALVMFASFIGVLLVYVAAAQAARPWYEPGAKVEDRGSGRLRARTGLDASVSMEKADT